MSTPNNKPSSKRHHRHQQKPATMVVVTSTSSSSSSSSPSRSSTGTNDTSFNTASDRARALLEAMKEQRESLTSVLRGSSGHYASSSSSVQASAVIAACSNNNTLDPSGEERGGALLSSPGSSSTATATPHSDNNLIILNVRHTIATQPRTQPLFTPLESACITKQLNDSLQQRRDRIFRISHGGGGCESNSSSTPLITLSSSTVNSSTGTTSGGKRKSNHHQRVITKSPHSQGTVTTEDSSSTITTDGVLSTASSSSSSPEQCASQEDDENDGSGGGASFASSRRQGIMAMVAKQQQVLMMLEGLKAPPFLQEEEEITTTEGLQLLVPEEATTSSSSSDVNTSMLQKSIKSEEASKADNTSTGNSGESSAAAPSSGSSSTSCASTSDSSSSSSSRSSSSPETSRLNEEDIKEEEGQADSVPVDANHEIITSPSETSREDHPDKVIAWRLEHEAFLIAAPEEDHANTIIVSRRLEGHNSQQQQHQPQESSPSRPPRMVPPAVVHCTAPCVVETLQMEKMDTPPKQPRRQLMEKDDTPHLIKRSTSPVPTKGAAGERLNANIESIKKRLVEQCATTPPPKENQQQQKRHHQDRDTKSERIDDSCNDEEEDEENQNCGGYMPESYSPQKSKRKPTSCSMEEATAASSKALFATKLNMEKSQSLSPQKSTNRPPCSPKKRIAGIALVQGHERHSRLLQTLQKALAEQNTGNENNTEENAAESQQKYQALIKTLQETVEDLAELYAQANLVSDDSPSDTIESDGVEWIISDESSFDCTTDGSNTSGWVSQEGEGSKIDSVLQYNTDHDDDGGEEEGTDSDTLTDQSSSGSSTGGSVPKFELFGHTLEPVLEESVVETSTCCSVSNMEEIPASLMNSQELQRTENFTVDSKTETSVEKKPAVVTLVSRQVQVCRAQGGLYKMARNSCGTLNGVLSWTKNPSAVIVVRSVPVHRSEDYLLLSAEVRCGTHGSMLDLACQTSRDLKSDLAKEAAPVRCQVKLPHAMSSGSKRWHIKARGGHYHIAVWTALSNDLILRRQLPPASLSLQQSEDSSKDLTKRSTNLSNGQPQIGTDEQCGAYGGLFHLATKTQEMEASNLLSCSF